MSDPVYIDVADVRGEDVVRLEGEQRKRVLARLELIAERLVPRGLAADVVVEWDFPAHEAVIREARAVKVDLIVAERHPAPHHVPWILRFTDFELLRRAPVPVLLVKARGCYARPKILAAIDPGHTFAKTLSLDAEILRYGSDCARALRGVLHVIHAFEPLPAGARAGDYRSADWIEELQGVTKKRTRAALKRTLRGVEISRSRQFVILRHPSDAIEEVAASIGADIVVMGAVSRTGLKRLLLGNTAEKVLDHLRCDVLIVKPKRLLNTVPRVRRGAQLIALSAFQPAI